MATSVEISPSRTAPGPYPLPLLGNLPGISRRGTIPWFREQWEKYGDTFVAYFGRQRVLSVVHPDGIERVLGSNRENYFKGKLYDSFRLLTGDGLLTLEGDAWRRRRRLAQPSFHRESIRGFTGTMLDVTRAKLEEWRRRYPTGGVIDLHDEMLHLTLEIVGRTLFGRGIGEQHEDSAEAFGAALALISGRGRRSLDLPLSVPTPANLRLKRALRQLDGVVYGIIADAKRAPGDASRPTLLTMLLSARDADTGEGLTDSEVRDEVMTLFLAGHETTALLLTWGFTLFGRAPEVVARMHAEVDDVLGDREPAPEDVGKLVYLRQVIDEILRVRPPTWALGRNAAAADVLCGFRVEPGDIVLLHTFFTHQHPAFWEQPHRFDPERFHPDRAKDQHRWAYFPFSLGPRMCIGNIFSLVEAQAILGSLLQQIEFELLPSPRPIEPVARITARPSGPVRVSLRWRA
jgi:cytochrome P450